MMRRSETLVDGRAGEDVKFIGVSRGNARLDFKKGSSGNHGAVVARELWSREINRVKASSGGFAEEGIGGNATSNDEGFCVGMEFLGSLKFI